MDGKVVLIESDWNLKYSKRAKRFENSPVLIESDWNLKVTVNRAMLKSAFSINRIRLEFKGGCNQQLTF